jgi:hypothetical protein
MTDKKAAALALLPRLDLAANYFTLSSSTVLELVDVARAVGYRAPKNRNGSTARYFFAYLARSPKTELLHVVQGNYGHGWEDLTASADHKEARANLKDYRQNDPAPTRLIKRRVKI